MSRLIPAHAGKTGRGDGGGVGEGAHPRSRGENAHSRSRYANDGGSSPLTRGKRRGRLFPLGERGLIPAHAGKTAPRPARARGLPAHPRSRGENIGVQELAGLHLGSSPLTRGKPFRQDARHVKAGLIPAHAGKTTRAVTEPARRRAHPRSRGENRVRRTSTSQRLGSSPLTRGKRLLRGRRAQRRRLIPAHAGKTAITGARASRMRAHPRSRGEN